MIIGGTDSSRQLRKFCYRLFECFDFVKIMLPDVEKRKVILRKCIEKLENVDDSVLTDPFIIQLAQKTNGYTLKKLQNYVKRTALNYQQNVIQNQTPTLSQQSFMQMLNYSSDSGSS